MRARQLLSVTAALGIGFGLGAGIRAGVAQADGEAQAVDSAWEIYHGSISNQKDNGFYVIKHNRLTGQTLVLSAEENLNDDHWYRLSVVDGPSPDQR